MLLLIFMYYVIPVIAEHELANFAITLAVAI